MLLEEVAQSSLSTHQYPMIGESEAVSFPGKKKENKENILSPKLRMTCQFNTF